MTNEQWLAVFKSIGKTMRSGLPSIMGIEGGLTPLGRGAGGDKTFPVDKWAEDIVLSALEKVHQQGESFTLVSEELGIRDFGKGTKRILVDPIDGSNNAKTGIPFFSTSIALLDGERLANLCIGYVLNLAAGDEFWAMKGEGAFKNGERITTSSSEEIIIVAYEASTPKKDIPKILPILAAARRARCFGSMALDLAYLASGAVSVCANATRSRAFDFAAGMVILTEAGGVITDHEGRALDSITAGLDRTVPVLASANNIIHRKAMRILAEEDKD